MKTRHGIPEEIERKRRWRADGTNCWAAPQSGAALQDASRWGCACVPPTGLGVRRASAAFPACAGCRTKLSGIALILTFSPWEKEQISRGSGIASTRPANAVEGISSGRPMIHPLLEGEGRGEVKPFQLNLFPKLSGIALILTFSPWEKEQMSRGSGIASTRPANADEGISSGRPMIPANARGLCWRGQAFSVSVYKSPRLARAGGDNAL